MATTFPEPMFSFKSDNTQQCAWEYCLGPISKCCNRIQNLVEHQWSCTSRVFTHPTVLPLQMPAAVLILLYCWAGCSTMDTIHIETSQVLFILLMRQELPTFCLPRTPPLGSVLGALDGRWIGSGLSISKFPCCKKAVVLCTRQCCLEQCTCGLVKKPPHGFRLT